MGAALVAKDGIIYILASVFVAALSLKEAKAFVEGLVV